ncbi:MAG TPA: PP2C family protein-serine/threonine phosphatase, partial [Bacteroidota bacterium]|nr:PP2C family protein-serine/threonine phosphatase [Bacteroidota bacterium]
RLIEGGIMLGVIEGFPFKQMTVPFNPGDLLLIYSDGVTEAMNPTLNFFGDENVLAALKKYQSGPVQGLIDGLISDVKTFAGSHPQSDDITILAVKRDG